MQRIPKSAEFVDGLQAAFKSVYRLQQRCTLPIERQIFSKALAVIDQEIERACKEDEVKIIV